LHSRSSSYPATSCSPLLLLLLLQPLPQARYNLIALKDEQFPRYKLFKKGADTKKPLEYSGNMKQAKELLRWTVEQTGVFIGIKVRCGSSLFKAAAAAAADAKALLTWWQQQQTEVLF
jgi:hypothetical protein